MRAGAPRTDPSSLRRVVSFRPRPTLGVVVLVVLQILAPSFLSAQVVIGRILDGQSQDPVILAELALVDSIGTVYDQTVSNHNGAFRLATDEPGDYYVVARALGYRTVVDGVLVLGEGGRLPITFYIQPRPIEMEGITATVERMERRLRSQGFYQREAQGFGHFITPEELESTPVPYVEDLLQRLPGVYAGGGDGVLMRGNRGGFCAPQVYLNGARVQPAGGGEGVRVDDFLNVQDLAGVEVYTRMSSAPLQYSVNNSCGLIVMWTK